MLKQTLTRIIGELLHHKHGKSYCDLEHPYAPTISVRESLYTQYRPPRVEVDSQLSGFIRTASALADYDYEVEHRAATTQMVAGKVSLLRKGDEE